MKNLSLPIFASVLIIALLLLNFGFLGKPQIEESPDFYVGVDVAYADIVAIKNLIDEISPYTNVFVIGSTGISYNETKLIETCQYIYEQDMYFIIYSSNPRRPYLLSDIQKKYEDHFLGVYFDDEQGGRQLDLFEYRWVYEADDYSDVAKQFVQGLKYWLNRNIYFNETYSTPRPSNFHLFTSDYTLYWFDYKAGYDTVFTEFGWN